METYKKIIEKTDEELKVYKRCFRSSALSDYITFDKYLSLFGIKRIVNKNNNGRNKTK